MAMTRFIFILAVITCSISNVLFGGRTLQVMADTHSPINNPLTNVPFNKQVLTILTLNIAHGRKDAFNQIFLSKKKISQNLLDIADVIRSQNADVVALQEADGPSRWSGNFDHVAFIADQAGYSWFYRAAHADSWLFNYGTAILSRLPIIETVEHTFKPSPPTFNKGFLLGRVMWNPNPDVERTVAIDIVSVHLDFSSKKVRRKQINEIADILLTRSSPMIILGDFNSEWFADDSVVKRLADKAHLKVYQPDATNLQTYLKGGKRLDWILLSNELDFVSHEVLPNVISDHQVVVATVALKVDDIKNNRR